MGVYTMPRTSFLSADPDPVSLSRFPREYGITLDSQVYNARSLTTLDRVPHSRRRLTPTEKALIKKLGGIRSHPLPDARRDREAIARVAKALVPGEEYPVEIISIGGGGSGGYRKYAGKKAGDLVFDKHGMQLRLRMQGGNLFVIESWVDSRGVRSPETTRQVLEVHMGTPGGLSVLPPGGPRVRPSIGRGLL